MSATKSREVRSPERVTAVRGCRAYGGPAHGRCWMVATDTAPPLAVYLGPDSDVVYRLIGRPGTRAPALDHLGNYLYMPLLSWAATTCGVSREIEAPVRLDPRDCCPAAGLAGALGGRRLTAIHH